MGAKESNPQPQRLPEEYDELSRALSAYSSYEIPLYMKALRLDINNPPEKLSPLHYIVEKTSRLNILQFLVEKMGGRPDLTWNNQSLFHVACEKKKTFFIKYLMTKYPLPTGKKPSPVEKELLLVFGGDAELLKEMQARWRQRVEAGRRMFFLKVVGEKRALTRLPQGLANEVVHYI